MYPGGKGGWLYGGQPPQEVDVVVSAERMNEISAYEPADMFIEAQAGAELDALERRTSECGQWLALDPPVAGEGRLEPWWRSGLRGHSRQASGRPGIRCWGPRSLPGTGACSALAVEW